MTSETTSGYPVESVECALWILLMLRGAPVVRVADMSRELGVPRSTAHRLLATLCQHGFVSQDRLTADRPHDHRLRRSSASSNWCGGADTRSTAGRAIPT